METPDHVLRLLQAGEPLAEIREHLAAAAEIAAEMEDGEELENILTAAVDEVDEALEDLDAGEENDGDAEPEANRMPVASMFDSRREFEQAKAAWRERKARRNTGPSDRRRSGASGLGIVTGGDETD